MEDGGGEEADEKEYGNGRSGMEVGGGGGVGEEREKKWKEIKLRFAENPELYQTQS